MFNVINSLINGGSRPGVWGAVRLEAPKGLHLVKYHVVCDNRWVSHKSGYLL